MIGCLPYAVFISLLIQFLNFRSYSSVSYHFPLSNKIIIYLPEGAKSSSYVELKPLVSFWPLLSICIWVHCFLNIRNYWVYHSIQIKRNWGWKLHPFFVSVKDIKPNPSFASKEYYLYYKSINHGPWFIEWLVYLK